MGFEIPSGMDDEVQVPGAGRGCWAEMPGIVTRDSAEQGDDDLCGVDQPRPRAYADQYTSPVIGIEGGAVSEGEEFTLAVDGVQGAEEEVLGPALMGEGILGCIEWECDR